MSKDLLKIENRIIIPIPGSKQQQSHYTRLDITKFAGPSGTENVDPNMCLQFSVTDRIATGETSKSVFFIRSHFQLQKLVSVLTDVLIQQTDGYFVPLELSQDEIAGTLDFKVNDEKRPLMLGDRRKFIEYAVLLNDIDSSSSLAGTCLLLEGGDNVEPRAIKIVKSDLEHIFGGNTVQPEFLGETGRTVWGIFTALKKGFKLADEITPATMNLDEYARHG